MTNIEIEKIIYKVHPVYNLYASDGNGNIIHLVKQVPSTGQKQKWLFVLYGKKTWTKGPKSVLCS